MASGDMTPQDEDDNDDNKNDSKKSQQKLEVDQQEVNYSNDNERLTNQDVPIGSNPISADGIKRTDNPFSFKHFLCGDSNYQNKGARPKVYCDGRPVSSVLDTQGQSFSDNLSVLPDFVQDHLVIEQCYLSNESNFNHNVQLPDFTQNNSNTRRKVEFVRNTSDSSYSVQQSSPIHARPYPEFPLDLPTSLNNGRPTNNEVAESKSLPDFLNDGAVHSQPNNMDASDLSPNSRPVRFHNEVDMLRHQLAEQTTRAEQFKRELESLKNQDNEYTQNLIKALEQVEDNLEKSNRRASHADATILKLRQEIVILKKEINFMKAENSEWNSREGAVGGTRHFVSQSNSQKLAHDLRNAASTAEISLRQLLSGVDNLRQMASALENIHRIEEKNEPFLNFDENSGPAL